MSESVENEAEKRVVNSKEDDPNETVLLDAKSRENSATETCSVPSQPVLQFKDITSEFFECCDDLKLGELLLQEEFGLFDAMSAIEMMDPKMDAG